MKYKIIGFATAGILILALAATAIFFGAVRSAGQEKDQATKVSASASNCVEVAPREYDCSDLTPEQWAKWTHFLSEEAKKAKDENAVVVAARITKYSPADSCHFPDGKGGCLNAQGTTVQEGEAACPHWLDFGTKILVEGEQYTCTDRTADWVQSKWIRTPTFDLFVNDCSKGCGRTFADVKVVAR